MRGGPGVGAPTPEGGWKIRLLMAEQDPARAAVLGLLRQAQEAGLQVALRGDADREWVTVSHMWDMVTFLANRGVLRTLWPDAGWCVDSSLGEPIRYSYDRWVIVAWMGHERFPGAYMRGIVPQPYAGFLSDC